MLDFFCKRKTGFIAHPQSPYYYIYCWDGTVERCGKCQNKMFFNTDCGKCTPSLFGTYICFSFGL